jgi:hypothetical protein
VSSSAPLHGQANCHSRGSGPIGEGDELAQLTVLGDDVESQSTPQPDVLASCFGQGRSRLAPGPRAGDRGQSLMVDVGVQRCGLEVTVTQDLADLLEPGAFSQHLVARLCRNRWVPISARPA